MIYWRVAEPTRAATKFPQSTWPRNLNPWVSLPRAMPEPIFRMCRCARCALTNRTPRCPLSATENRKRSSSARISSPRAIPRKETFVEAPVVYVGFGVTAPEQNYDDYKGTDAKGKIVAMVFEAPNFESSLKAHYSSFEQKIANAAAHGAVGLIVVNDPILEGLYPFKEQVRDLSRPALRWLSKEGMPNDYFPQLHGAAILSLDASKQLFLGSGHTPEEVFQSAKEGKSLAFPLPLS